jgi:hypothetical protein
MNQLYVEANKHYKHGFVLSESELRRFNDLIREQIKKINQHPDLSFIYQLKFQNGIVAETDNIDTILSQENDGSKRIVFLQVIGKDQQDNSIAIGFFNLESDAVLSDHSVKYNIKSTDRDWVFVTSSQIEERIAKIKRFDFFPRNKSSSRLFILFFPLVVMLGMTVSLIGATSKANNYLVGIRDRYVKGEIKGIDQLIFAIEEAKQENVDLTTGLFYPGIVAGGLIVLIIFIYLYISKFYPLHNFCWGDYLDVFRRKEAARKTFNTVVILGLIISIIGGVITNFLYY